MTSSFSITIQPGGKWSAYISRGKSMTLTANRANLSTLLFHAPYPSERYAGYAEGSAYRDAHGGTCANE